MELTSTSRQRRRPRARFADRLLAVLGHKGTKQVVFDGFRVYFRRREPREDIVVSVGQLPDPAATLVTDGPPVTILAELLDSSTEVIGLPDVRALSAGRPAVFQFPYRHRRVPTLEPASRAGLQEDRSNLAFAHDGVHTPTWWKEIKVDVLERDEPRETLRL